MLRTFSRSTTGSTKRKQMVVWGLTSQGSLTCAKIFKRCAPDLTPLMEDDACKQCLPPQRCWHPQLKIEPAAQGSVGQTKRKRTFSRRLIFTIQQYVYVIRVCPLRVTFILAFIFYSFSVVTAPLIILIEGLAMLCCPYSLAAIELLQCQWIFLLSLLFL